jgi:hypothetical protein
LALRTHHLERPIPGGGILVSTPLLTLLGINCLSDYFSFAYASSSGHTSNGFLVPVIQIDLLSDHTSHYTLRDAVRPAAGLSTSSRSEDFPEIEFEPGQDGVSAQYRGVFDYLRRSIRTIDRRTVFRWLE